MWKVVLSEEYHEALRSHLLASANEEAAVLVCGTTRSPDGGGRLLVRAIRPVPPEGLEYHTGGAVSIKPEWLAAVVKAVRADGLTVALAHSHPFSTKAVRFSAIDTEGQARLIPAIQRRLPSQPLCELVFGQESVDGLLWEDGGTAPVPVIEILVVGRKITRVPTSMTPRIAQSKPVDGTYARQALIWGELGQQRLRSLRVGVTGAGGNGSWVCAELIHLGVGVLVSVDPDLVEDSNRPRVVGSRPEDVSNCVPKVEVVRRYAAEHNPDVVVVPVHAGVETPEALAALKECDLLIGCTDTYASRNVLNSIALRYLIPFIDTGVEVELEGDQLRTVATRCAYVLPGGPCLWCAGFVTQAALDAEAGAQRPGYVPGVPSPSVGPLNALVASTAVLDVLRLVHGLLGGLQLGEFVAYSGRSRELRRCAMGSGGCSVCLELYGCGDLEATATEPARVRASASGIT